MVTTHMTDEGQEIVIYQADPEDVKRNVDGVQDDGEDD